MKYEKMMDETKFWDYIMLLNFNQDDEEDIIEPLVDALSKKSKNEIFRFEERLAYFLYTLDTEEVAMNIGENSYSENEDYFSPDYFLYARCLVIAKGKDAYQAVIQDPVNMIKNTDFEILLEVPALAYEEKTGDDYEYIAKYDYETFSNEAGWKQK